MEMRNVFLDSDLRVRGAYAVVCGGGGQCHTEARLIHRSGIVTTGGLAESSRPETVSGSTGSPWGKLEPQ